MTQIARPGRTALQGGEHAKRDARKAALILTPDERVHGEFLFPQHFLGFASLLRWVMRDLAVLFLHLLATVAWLAGPGGARPWYPSPFS